MNVLDRNAIAAHVLRYLASAQARGRLVRLESSHAQSACAVRTSARSFRACMPKDTSTRGG